MLYTASQAGALVVALLFCPFLSPHSLHLFCKFALDFLFADFQCVKRHPRPNQGRGCHFLRMSAYYAFGGGTGKLPARRRHRGQGISPASCAKCTFARCLRPRRQGAARALAPPAAGLSFRGRSIFIYCNGNSISVAAKTAQIPFLASVMWR